MQVSVRDNNVDQALRVLKKKLQSEGVFQQMKLILMEYRFVQCKIFYLLQG